MIGKYAFGLAVMLAFASTAFAQNRAPNTSPFPLSLPSLTGTPEEEAACKPDVHRYCREAEPDTFRVLGCLQSNRTKISQPCRRVLESHNQ